MVPQLHSALHARISLALAIAVGAGALVGAEFLLPFNELTQSAATAPLFFTVTMSASTWAVCQLSVMRKLCSWICFNVTSGRDGLVPNAPSTCTDVTATARRMPVGLPSSKYLLAQINCSIGEGCEATILALIELKDFARLYAFDPDSANEASTAFARRLRQIFGKKYPVAHLGGGDFGIWFKDCGTESARQELRTVSYVIQGEIKTAKVSFMPDVRVKVGRYPNDGTDADGLITKTSISGLSPEADEQRPDKAENKSRHQYSLEQGLRHAVERQELALHFQPIVDLAQARMVGAEALLRWSHPSFGNVSPATFIPLLEEMGLIQEFGMWSLNSACAAVRAWNNDGFGDLSVAVNLSAKQLHDPALVTAVERSLNRHKLSPKCLTLELTETAAMQDAERTLALFNELKELKVAISIDDFGTGYSSLSYLLKLPFDRLKIDREFVTNVHQNSQRRAICRSLVELAKGLQISLVAEGAEKKPEVEALQKLGCNLVQGFYFSQPVPGDQIPVLAAKAFWNEGPRSGLPVRLVPTQNLRTANAHPHAL